MPNSNVTRADRFHAFLVKEARPEIDDFDARWNTALGRLQRDADDDDVAAADKFFLADKFGWSRYSSE